MILSVNRDRPHSRCGLVTRFLWWSYLRAVFHRGYVLVSSLYFVINAHLSASQLVTLGTVIGVTLVLSDVPSGVWADAFSRKWPLAIGHLFLATGMVMTGLVTSFPLILATQVLWGLGWGLSSGADVAWITDELDEPRRVDRVLATRARWELAGGATGMVTFGLLGWAIGVATAIMVSGLAMVMAGLLVVMTFSEDNFRPAPGDRWLASWLIIRRGTQFARRDLEILLVLASTIIINGASIVAWLFPKQLINLGFPNDPLLWYAGLRILASLFGTAILRLVESRISGPGSARRVYALACVVGVLGLILLARAPGVVIGSAGVLLVTGVTFSVTRVVSVIWVNRRTTSDVRATLHSFLGQSESIGEIVGGFAFAAIAREVSIPVVLSISAGMVACAGAIVVWAHADPHVATEVDE